MVGKLVANKFYLLRTNFLDVVKIHALIITVSYHQKFFAVIGRERVVVQNMNRHGRRGIFENRQHCRAREF
jgi:hypothetical protein